MRQLLLFAFALTLAPSLVAAQSLTVDPKISRNFRISDMGDLPGDQDFSVTAHPGVIANPDTGEFLVFWSGSDDANSLFEVFVQRLSPNGDELGSAIQITQQSQGNPSFGTSAPEAVYNPNRQEYFVAFTGREFFDGANGREIFARRLDSTGQPLGTELRLTSVGEDDGVANAYHPSIAHNAVDDEYLVVWYADDPVAGLADNEYEIFGLLLDGLGQSLSPPFRISQMGAGAGSAAAFEPDVAFDPINRWYFVVWQGADTTISADQEFEIYGQLLDADGAEIGTDDLRISYLGPFGGADFDAGWPAVALNPETREWLVVWHGDDNLDGLVDDEYEIFGKLLGISGNTVLTEFRISTMGGTGFPEFGAFVPDIVADGTNGSYLVTWTGLDRDGEVDIYGQRLGPDGGLLGRRVRVSAAGSAPGISADEPALAQSPEDGQFLVIWRGDDVEGGHVLFEWDVFGQRLSFPFFFDGFESGDLSAWSLQR